LAGKISKRVLNNVRSPFFEYLHFGINRATHASATGMAYQNGLLLFDGSEDEDGNNSNSNSKL